MRFAVDIELLRSGNSDPSYLNPFWSIDVLPLVTQGAQLLLAGALFGAVSRFERTPNFIRKLAIANGIAGVISAGVGVADAVRSDHSGEYARSIDEIAIDSGADLIDGALSFFEAHTFDPSPTSSDRSTPRDAIMARLDPGHPDFFQQQTSQQSRISRIVNYIVPPVA